MKKLLVILMVVAMASFLFVGCFGVPETYTLTMAVNPTGGGTTNPAVGAHPNYTAGTLVSISATPATGYKFVNWTGAVAAPNLASTTVTMDADKTVTANFELITVVTTTVAPIIIAVSDIDITSSATQYVNRAEAVDGITVTGTAPTYSEVKVYINGITAGTGDATATGAWTVLVANADLIKAGSKVEGAKTLHATATDLGLPESASSNVINFTLDTVIPFIASSVGTSGTVPVAVGGTVAEVLLSDTGNFFNGEVVNNVALLVAGNWKIEIQSILDGILTTLGVVDTGDTITFRITSPTGVLSTYSYSYITAVRTFTTLIPGVSVNFPSTAAGVYNALTFNNIGAEVFETVATQALPTAGWVTVTFNEPVTGASILAGTWTAFAATVNLVPAVTVRGAAIARLTETTVAGLPNLRIGRAYSVSVSGIIDLAGNIIPATAPSSDSGVVTL